MRSSSARVLAAAGVGAIVLLTSCGTPHGGRPPVGTIAPSHLGAGPATGPSVAVPPPFRGATVTPHLLVHAQDTLPPRVRDRVGAVPGVTAVTILSVGQVALGGRTVRIAAAEPASLRRYTPAAVAGADDVWTRVAGGEVAVDPSLRRLVTSPDGHLVLGQDAAAPRAHVGAFATLPPLLDAVVNPRWGDVLGMPPRNAVLVSVDEEADRDAVTDRVRRVVGRRAAVQQLARDARVSGPQKAYLTGGSVAQAVGSFTFVPRRDGTLVVDPTWVAANIRTEEVPLLGAVTCHRVLLPQLRGALREVVDRGLAAAVRPGEYGGCFHPRYIGHDPARGLSLHSWGVAVDLNVPGNQRGTTGEIDRRVVAIFKRWGFAWGGDWAWTDPMHFELAALVRPS